MKINGNVELHPSGLATILNAFIERVTDDDEINIAPQLSEQHASRLVYNTTSNTLKVWTGSHFAPLLSTDNNEAQAMLSTLIEAFGFITDTGAFDAAAFEAFANVYSDATRLLDVLRSFDSKLSQTATQIAEQTLSALRDVAIAGPLPDAVLAYDWISQQWASTNLTLGHISDVSVSTSELEALIGITVTIQPELDRISSELSELSSTSTTNVDAINALQENVSILMDTASDLAAVAAPFVGEISLQRGGSLVQMSGDVQVTGLPTVSVATFPLEFAPVVDRVFVVPAFIGYETLMAAVTVTTTGELYITSFIGRPVEETESVIVNLTSIMYVRV